MLWGHAWLLGVRLRRCVGFLLLLVGVLVVLVVGALCGRRGLGLLRVGLGVLLGLLLLLVLELRGVLVVDGGLGRRACHVGGEGVLLHGDFWGSVSLHAHVLVGSELTALFLHLGGGCAGVFGLSGGMSRIALGRRGFLIKFHS